MWDEESMVYVTIQHEEGSMRGGQNPLLFGVLWIRTIEMGLQGGESALLGHGYLS